MTDTGGIDLTTEQQAVADKLIDALGKRKTLPSHPALSHLVEMLEEDDNDVLTSCVSDAKNYIFAPTLEELVERAALDFDGSDDVEAIVAAVREQAELALAGKVEFWGEDGHWGPILATITHTDGRSRVLVLKIIDYGTGPYSWDGVFASVEAVQACLADQGHITSMEQFDAIPGDSILNEWAQHC